MRWYNSLLALALAIFAQPQQAQEYTVTAYCLQGTMRSGAYTYVGAVAVDPRVIPLGSTVTIDTLGTFIAEDTGGGVIGQHVDVYMYSCTDAINFGRQRRLVEVLP